MMQFKCNEIQLRFNYSSVSVLFYIFTSAVTLYKLGLYLKQGVNSSPVLPTLGFILFVRDCIKY